MSSSDHGENLILSDQYAAFLSLARDLGVEYISLSWPNDEDGDIFVAVQETIDVVDFDDL